MDYKHTKLQSLYDTKDHTDCTFIFPDLNKKIKAHKLLLTLSSPVFERMFYGDLGRECRECRDGNEILIEDVKPEVFDKFLRYIYTDAIQIDNVLEAWNLFYVCQKYFLCELQEQCLNYIKNNRSLSNLLLCYEHAVLYDQDKMAAECLEDMWTFPKGLFMSLSLEINKPEYEHHPQAETIRTLSQQSSLGVALIMTDWAFVECNISKLPTTVENISGVLKENRLQITKHYVSPPFYKLLDRGQKDIVELYNDLTSSMYSTATVKTTPRYKFKFRQEYKNAFRLPIHRREILSPKIWSTCDCFVFGVSIATKSKPQQETANDYLGGANIYVYLKDNESLSNLIYIHEGGHSLLHYNDVQNVIFDAPILCRAYISYMICIEYKAETQGESVLLTYKSDKLTSVIANKNKGKNTNGSNKSVICFGDEENGGVIKGICFYEV